MLSDRQRGFTLIELLVAMTAAIVVIAGATQIMIVTLHQTQRTFTTIDATRQARTALAVIENELHSACVDGTPPIQAASTATTMNFISAPGSAARPTPVWHVLSFHPGAGTLTDTTYPAVASGARTGPAWLQGSAPTSQVTLLGNVLAQPSTPVFRYYAYAQVGSDSAGGAIEIVPDGANPVPGQSGPAPDMPLSTAGAGLAASDAAATVEVAVNLLVGPATNSSLSAVQDPVTDSVSLRLTTPPDVVPAGAAATGYGPCQ